MSSTLFAILLALPAVFVFWTFSSTSSSPFARRFPRLYNKRICLLIAHPDDEAMFFAPTVLALTKPGLGNHLKILCFSSGDADGLGPVRKKELQQSAKHLGVRSESDVFVVDDPSRFPDSMTKQWSDADISSLLASAFAPELGGFGPVSSQRKKQNGSAAAAADNKKPPLATIDVLVTFDQHGVSNHPNHTSLYHGARQFLRILMKNKHGFSCPVTLYSLASTSILRKYLGVLDAPVSMFLGALSSLLSSGSRSRSRARKSKDDPPARLLFISSVAEWYTALSAMVSAHKSQMVWFRWGWISLGRYMAVNDLKRERV
ncbi:N-acetylglucosaminylphosphatidylinositol deacetylase [Aspergillus sp. HF37]|nr:N-acetylglucosaminylphosphatidylinositol deacetylase [Aspergillus sp. HF37]